mmetsp:Transcript_41391/g.119096  ORF Transcript_41391/g.119096 Transcript_41391/m.119096 type:complete len:516 (+) Transcript_41391:603-2150(+)
MGPAVSEAGIVVVIDRAEEQTAVRKVGRVHTGLCLRSGLLLGQQEGDRRVHQLDAVGELTSTILLSIGKAVSRNTLDSQAVVGMLDGGVTEPSEALKSLQHPWLRPQRRARSRGLLGLALPLLRLRSLRLRRSGLCGSSLGRFGGHQGGGVGLGLPPLLVLHGGEGLSHGPLLTLLAAQTLLRGVEERGLEGQLFAIQLPRRRKQRGALRGFGVLVLPPASLVLRGVQQRGLHRRLGLFGLQLRLLLRGIQQRGTDGALEILVVDGQAGEAARELSCRRRRGLLEGSRPGLRWSRLRRGLRHGRVRGPSLAAAPRPMMRHTPWREGPCCETGGWRRCRRASRQRSWREVRHQPRANPRGALPGRSPLQHPLGTDLHRAAAADGAVAPCRAHGPRVRQRMPPLLLDPQRRGRPGCGGTLMPQLHGVDGLRRDGARRAAMARRRCQEAVHRGQMRHKGGGQAWRLCRLGRRERMPCAAGRRARAGPQAVAVVGGWHSSACGGCGARRWGRPGSRIWP